MSGESDIALPAVERVSQTTFMAITWTATWFSFLMLVMRVAIRLRTLRKLLADDYLVIAAWLMLLTSASLWQDRIGAMYWMYDIQTGERPPSLDFIDVYGRFLPLVVAWNILFYSCLWAVKFSFMLFFRRLGDGVLSKVWWWAVMVLTAIGWVACIADIDWGCSLSEITFIMQHCILKSQVQFDDRTFYANMAVDVVTDLLILTIPFRILWNVRIPFKKKALLLGVFSLTIIIMVVAIIRVALVKGISSEVRVSSIDWLYFWSNIEAGIAIVVACLASFRQLFVYNKESQEGSGRSGRRNPWSLRSLMGFTRLTKGSSIRPLQGTEDTWGSGRGVHAGSHDSAEHIVPLESVHVKQSFEVTTSDSNSATTRKVKARNGGYDYI
ncbi:unnamed protein product [Clonostachys solani]|uniref:Rhodopsin domain-containing protein n=1 Tax=Clonostachys solani TaxID=160281 RepID=A0A9N9W1S1_9HYPO|nr:unnamed protein product [Clonostachys solani]